MLQFFASFVLAVITITLTVSNRSSTDLAVMARSQLEFTTQTVGCRVSKIGRDQLAMCPPMATFGDRRLQIVGPNGSQCTLAFHNEGAVTWKATLSGPCHEHSSGSQITLSL